MRDDAGARSPESLRVPDAFASSDRARIDEPIVIKKYANRRLYNTASSAYVTLEHLSDMVKEGKDFVVYDAKTNEDITRSVLTQIIFEQEGRNGQNLLPISFLRQLIRFYGDNMQAFLPSYLEMSLDSFSKQQESLREKFAGGFTPVGANFFEEQVRQNMALFDRAMKMFTPFAYAPKAEAAPSEPVEPSKPAADPDLAEMKRQLAAMQAQIEKLAGRG
jgi:polyhydroxyalkanoate synthesis repressor PhaR